MLQYRAKNTQMEVSPGIFRRNTIIVITIAGLSHSFLARDGNGVEKDRRGLEVQSFTLGALIASLRWQCSQCHSYYGIISDLILLCIDGCSAVTISKV